MVTHYPQIASGDTLASAGGANRVDAGFGARAFTWIRQTYCALHGHDRLLHFEKDRMSLRCSSCGHDSPGWELKEIPRPAMRLRGETRRAALRPHLVGARRIA
jgi:hypothetical protein